MYLAMACIRVIKCDRETDRQWGWGGEKEENRWGPNLIHVKNLVGTLKTKLHILITLLFHCFRYSVQWKKQRRKTGHPY